MKTTSLSYLTITMLFLLLISCSSKKNNSFVISGKISNLNEDFAILSVVDDIQNNKTTIIDTLKINKKGKFNSVYFLEPNIYNLTFDNKKTVTLAIDEGQQINIKGESIDDLKITGSIDTDLLNAYEDFRKESLTRLVKSVRNKIKNLQLNNALEKEITELRNLEIENYQKHLNELILFIKEKMEEQKDNYLDNHYIHRSNWLRAAVLGANDGILSTASLAIGVAAASDSRELIVFTTLAGLVAGALSMAAGEYVSVSSQTDIEKGDIERERQELEQMPEMELQRLADIYVERGLKKDTALIVAKELTAHDALGAHIRDELGLNEISQAQPIQAAFASGAAFTVGGVLPLLVALFLPLKSMEYTLYGFALFFLIILGSLAAKTGGSSMVKAIVRITFWGTIAMGLTALVGYMFNVNVG